MSSSRTLNIAILDADSPVPAVFNTRGLYSDIFASLLPKAAERLSAPTTSSKQRKQSLPKLSFQAYNIVQNQYPTNLSSLSGIIITGAAASAYDTDAWVQNLATFIRETYTSHPSIRWFGSCFGHQIICQVLLKDHGVYVAKGAGDWETGVRDVELTTEFRRAWDAALTTTGGGDGDDDEQEEKLMEPLPESLKFQIIHGDHVIIPPFSSSSSSSEEKNKSLPENWTIMGSTPDCAVQGILAHSPLRVLTYQGHCEFDRFVNTETLKVFSAAGTSTGGVRGWGEDVVREMLKGIDRDDDAKTTAEIVAAFFLVGREDEKLETGLLTPPDEEGGLGVMG